MRTAFLTPVVGNVNRSKETNGTPSKAYTNSVPDQHSLYPDGQHTIAFYTKCVPPLGRRCCPHAGNGGGTVGVWAVAHPGL